MPGGLGCAAWSARNSSQFRVSRMRFSRRAYSSTLSSGSAVRPASWTVRTSWPAFRNWPTSALARVSSSTSSRRLKANALLEKPPPLLLSLHLQQRPMLLTVAADLLDRLQRQVPAFRGFLPRHLTGLPVHPD